jgi:hypothetical protein
MYFIYNSWYVIVFALSLLYMYQKGEADYQATEKWCTASETFYTWRVSNPYVYIGLSDTGKILLTNLIVTYDIFLKRHPFCDDRGHREYLMSLFDDLPPRPHKPTPKNNWLHKVCRFYLPAVLKSSLVRVIANSFPL